MLTTKPIYYFLVVSFLLNNYGVNSALSPALYVFGDSLFDSGNNNWLPTLARVNYPPYGTNFAEGPTGRFTNGKHVADFIAEYLELPYPPPYLDPLRDFQPSKLTGYNYASGACGILRETGNDNGVCLHMDKQMSLFERTVRKQLSSNPKLRNPIQLSKHLAKSIFVFSTGNNDYLGNYFDDDSHTRQRYNPLQFTQILIHAFSLTLQKLYKLGARKVVVFELGPLGCLGSVVRKFKPEGRCAEDVNEIVTTFNTQLSSMLNNLTQTLEDSHFIIGHTYSLAYDAIINPRNYGLIDSKNPCCKAWKNGTSACIPILRPCSNPNKHFFWDGIHPSEAVSSVVASRCIDGSSGCLPLNIRQLVNV